MDVTLSWENHEKTIVRYHVQQGWNWEDLRALLDRNHRLSSDNGYALDMMIDVTDAAPIPSDALFGLNAMESARQFAHHAETLGYNVVLVGATRMIQAMYTRFHISQSNSAPPVQFTATLQEAHALLNRQRLRSILATV